MIIFISPYKALVGILLFWSVVVNSYQLKAQCFVEVDEQAWKQYLIADSLHQIASPNATSEFKKAYQLDTLLVEALYKLGIIYYEKSVVSSYDVLNHSYTEYYSKKSKQYLLKAIEKCPQLSDYKAYYCIGGLYYFEKDFTLSAFFYNEFLKYSTINSEFRITANERVKECHIWNNWQNEPIQKNRFDLFGINSNGNEQAPFITPSGQWLIFKRQTNEPEKNTVYSSTLEKYFIARPVGIDTNQNWMFEVKGEISAMLSESEKLEHISLDESTETLYCTVCKKEKLGNQNIESCKIGTSALSNWPNLNIDWLDTCINQNGSSQKYAMVSANGKTLFFSSNQTDGGGGFDIYKSERDSLGNWTKSKNLGNTVNTLNDELYPQLHFDNQTLFFSSNGKFGKGGFDLYCAKGIDNHWDEVENLGPQINSTKDEKEITVDALGINAIASTNYFGFKSGTDIVAFEIPYALRPIPSIIINGRINDHKANPFDKTEISLIPLNGAKFDQGQIMIKDDYFSMILPKQGTQYLITVSKPGYVFANQFVDFTNGTNATFLNVTMQPLKKGVSFTLNGVFFPKNSALLDKKSEPLLNSFIQYLNEYSQLEFEIKTQPKLNVALNAQATDVMNKRSQAIFQYLRFNGISPSRIQCLDFETVTNEEDVESNLDDFEIVVKVVGL